MRHILLATTCAFVAGCAVTDETAMRLAGTEPGEASGCWVHAFGEKAYRPPVVTYTGPTREPRVARDARSLMVGPEARLVGRSGAGEESLILPPGARVPDLAAIDFHAKVASFDLACVAGDVARALGGPGQ